MAVTESSENVDGALHKYKTQHVAMGFIQMSLMTSTPLQQWQKERTQPLVTMRMSLLVSTLHIQEKRLELLWGGGITKLGEWRYQHLHILASNKHNKGKAIHHLEYPRGLAVLAHHTGPDMIYALSTWKYPSHPRKGALE